MNKEAGLGLGRQKEVKGKAGGEEPQGGDAQGGQWGDIVC
jgi:hypothetical protein